MIRHALLATAALGAMGACAGMAAGAAETCVECLDAGIVASEAGFGSGLADGDSFDFDPQAGGRSPLGREPSYPDRLDHRFMARGQLAPEGLDTGSAGLAPGPGRLDQRLNGAGGEGENVDFGLGDPASFEDVMTLELDVARIANALGYEVDRTDAKLMGRVALHLVDDHRVGAPPTVTDVYDPYVRAIEEARTPAPVNVYDLDAAPRGVLPRRGVRVDYARPLTSELPGALEVAVEPRANVLLGEVSGLGGGAIVRFGRNLTSPRERSSRWYAFAGADAQALTWSLGGARQDQVLRLEDKQLVGDYQAGVALRVADGDLAFGYVHREVSWNDVSREEQFVGVSFTRRR